MSCWSGRTGTGIFGTKMRSVINDADKDGVTAIVEQQFEYGVRISSAGLVPILARPHLATVAAEARCRRVTLTPVSAKTPEAGLNNHG